MHMANTGKRDNAYWLQRFEKDGHRALIKRIEDGEISVYKAREIAGYREPGPRTPVAKLSHHWKRANAEERLRFVAAHAKDINRVLLEVRDQLVAAKAQKAKETEQI